MWRLRLAAASCLLIAACSSAALGDEDNAMWTVYVTNDNCPDYTWGLTEKQTRQAFADVVRGHLDEMNRTDARAPADRDHYNMAVTQEALCFVERYPQRKDELIRRIKEGRVYVSPFLCNSLWAFQSTEGAIRTLYPAARLERRWGIRFDVAEHIEQPSAPWGIASILAGCGIRWLSVPYYGYDSTFAGLKNPPLLTWVGPDGGSVRMILDRWACGRSSYMQGARLLKKPESITAEWIPHYRRLGKAYGVRAILASGTHGDISPHSGRQARGYAEAIRNYNARPGRHPKLVNAALPQFCRAVDEAEARAAFLPAIRGCFGHSWDLWPICLAKVAADMRRGERTMLAAEALLALAGCRDRAAWQATRADRQRAEWCWAMLSDHAWNGTGEANRRHNAKLRRDWAAELNRLAAGLTARGWRAMGRKDQPRELTIFNPLSVSRRGLVRIAAPPRPAAVACGKAKLPCQLVREGDDKDMLCFVTPAVKGFGLLSASLTATGPAETKATELRATPTVLESPLYRLTVAAETGQTSSLIHRPTNTELVAPGARHGLCETVYFDGEEHRLRGVKTEVAAIGPVLARLRISGAAAGIKVTTLVTVYADLDRVDFDVRIDKPVTSRKQRLCQVFPVARKGSTLRIETTGAVIRPRPRPAGDLLPGADTRRFAVQGFVDSSPAAGMGVTVAPLDAFALRTDLTAVTFEALGNDQNYREVVQDQGGVRQFRFRYALRARIGGYDGAEAVAFSRHAAMPLLAARGRVDRPGDLPAVRVDPRRAVATCLKPADGRPAGGVILRLWETAGRTGPIDVGVRGFRKAVRTDLLERDTKQLAVADGRVAVDLPPHGFAAVRLLP